VALGVGDVGADLARLLDLPRIQVAAGDGPGEAATLERHQQRAAFVEAEHADPAAIRRRLRRRLAPDAGNVLERAHAVPSLCTRAQTRRWVSSSRGTLR